MVLCKQEAWWTWCIANVEWVKVGECEVMKASGEGCSRPETNLMGKIAAECKMMGLPAPKMFQPYKRLGNRVSATA